MPQESSPVLQYVSANLRAARHALGWSQDKLAQLASVSRRMLVGIEAGESNVSLATLDRLAAALGVSFAALVRPPASPGDRPPPVLAWRGRHPDSRANLLESAATDGNVVELWEWRLAPGDAYTPEIDPPGWQEMIYVVAGALTVEAGGVARQIAAGQSLLFRSDHAYAYRNDGEVPVAFVKNVMTAGGAGR